MTTSQSQSDRIEGKLNILLNRRVAAGGTTLLVAMTYVSSCESKGKLADLKYQMDQMQRSYSQQVAVPQLSNQQVVGNETMDKFYTIDGRRAYVEIDGEAVEDHFKNYCEEEK